MNIPIKQLKFTVCFLILSALLFKVSSQPVFIHENFLLPLEKSFLDTTKIISKEVCCSYSFTILKQGPNTKEKTIKFTLLDSDPIINSGVRSELAFKPEPKVKVNRWYSFDIYLPPNYIADSTPEILAQWHEIPDFDRGETWRSPPISLWTQGNRWYLHILWSGDTINTNKTAHAEIYDLGEIKKKEWTSWVFHINFSWEADGKLEIWQQNKKIFIKNGPNAYNDKVGEYFKIGIYKWVWSKLEQRKTSITQKREVYYKNIKVGNEKQDYQTFIMP